MKNYNFCLSLLILAIFYGCASSDPKFAKDEPHDNFGYPKEKEIEKSFYLIGDAGYSPPGGISKGLIALKTYLDSVKKVDNYTIFLGDNIYPGGMPPKDASGRETAEYHVDAQLDAIENYKGKVIFIPGNHDWYNEGINGMEREEKYLKEKFGDSLIWAPKTGCGVQTMDIGDNIELIMIDTQWYLEDWDRNPTINDDCAEIKTREAMFLEVQSELEKSQDKSIIIAMHHPVYTNGVHGGQYNFDRHLYPSQKKIPLPILGSLASLIRTTGGVSIQDRQNERYKSLVKRMETLLQNTDRAVIVSGHEHTLQYIEHDSIKQVVSGSGSKGNYVTLSNDGLFAYPEQGFAVYDVFKDGSSWISFYGNEDNKPKLLYQKEVHAAPQEYDVSDLKTHFPQTMKASVYEKKETEKGPVHRTLWGERYRELYGKKVTLPVADLDTLYGGLEPIREGGGHQTVSVRVKDSLGREYNIRRIRKDAVQFLQTVAFKDTPIGHQLENTVAEGLLNDLYTASHPYAFLTIPTLSEAINLAHTNPKLVYLPKQKNLGKYNNDHGDDIYMIVERPEEHWLGYESFDSPNHDIVSTGDMFERLRRDEKYSLDEAAYVKARIFDMLVGDWDRHQDQWRWAEIENKEGEHLFEPIPRDRDQVFSNFDGAFFGTLRALAGFTKQFAVYGEDIKNVEWFNVAAVGLDRSLLQNTGRETWMQQAKYVQENITDQVIEEAFSKLPPETQNETTDELIKKLKGRRDNIVDIAKRYYDYLAKLAIVTGTDKDDFIDITRMEDGDTRVKISRNKGGERADVLSDKIYKKGETHEIWVYGLDDDDKFLVEGPGKNGIFLRIIGGQNNDIYTIKNGRNLKVYDHKSKPNTIKEPGNAKFRFTDNYAINTYDKDKKIFSSGSLLPGFGYNPDDGFRLGVESVYTVNKFKRNPFTSQHTLGAGFYFATSSFNLYYKGEFARIVGNYNFQIGAHYTNPNFTENFFGYGNETLNFDDELDYDYNRVRLSRVGGDFGLVNETPFGSLFSYKANFESVRIDDTPDRFITEDFTSPESDYFSRKYFAGLDALYKYESYDDKLNPTRGMKFYLNLGGKMNTAEVDQNFGYFKSYLGFYNAVTRNRKLVVHSRIQTQINIGDDYEFYQAARLGGDNGLRGYRLNRFTGKKLLATGADLRYSFNQFKTSLLPFQIGVYAGYDLGRVWEPGEDSKIWHDSYGGGIWVNSAQSLNGTFSLFDGGEGWRFAFGFGLKF